MTDYFTELGKNVARAMANPNSRAAMKRLMDTGLAAHLASGGRMALDAMPTGMPGMPSSMMDQEGPNGGGEGEDPEVEKCIQLVTHWLQNVPDDQRQALVGRLHELISAAHANANGGNGNGGNECAAVGDNGNGMPPRGQTRAAMDAAFAARGRRTADFQRRHPYLNVSLSGTGR